MNLSFFDRWNRLSFRLPLLIALFSAATGVISAGIAYYVTSHAFIDTAKERMELVRNERAHEREHSIEVQLPFLQTLLGSFSLVPLVVGDASAEAVAEVLERLWGGSETLIVISSDLSHFHDHATATRLDGQTADAIVEFRIDDLRGDRACGYLPISGLLSIAVTKMAAGRVVGSGILL